MFCFFYLALQGCVIIPLPEKCVSGDEVTPEELTVMQPARTTKKEIVELLGEPDIFWIDENIYAYNWTMRWAVMPWAVGTPYQAAAGIEDLKSDYVLLLQFNKDDRLLRYEKIKRSLFESYGKLLEEWADQNNDQPCPENQTTNSNQ